jgi:hypothetical protein
LLTCVATIGLAHAADVYKWSRNIAIDPFTESRQQGEPALATDANRRVWLAFIDASYRQIQSGKWVDWPRRVRHYSSEDGGRNFQPRPDLGSLVGDEWLAADTRGGVFASYVRYEEGHVPLQQRIAIRSLSPVSPVNAGCLPADERSAHDQSNIHVGQDGVLHVIGMDIAVAHQAAPLLYARSEDSGKSCMHQQAFASIGQLPQAIDLTAGLMIVGPAGFYISADHGIHFSPRVVQRFGLALSRAATSPSRDRIYVVGDSMTGGITLQASVNGGKNWHATRVDDAPRATAWRYPALHVDARGRVHVIWMDDRSGSGGLYHAYSENLGASFSPSTRVSDEPFRFPRNAPPPAPATQDGTWIGDYHAVTSVGDQIIVAWSDQRAGTPKSVLRVAIGSFR